MSWHVLYQDCHRGPPIMLFICITHCGSMNICLMLPFPAAFTLPGQLYDLPVSPVISLPITCSLNISRYLYIKIPHSSSRSKAQRHPHPTAPMLTFPFTQEQVKSRSTSAGWELVGTTHITQCRLWRKTDTAALVWEVRVLMRLSHLEPKQRPTRQAPLFTGKSWKNLAFQVNVKRESFVQCSLLVCNLTLQVVCEGSRSFLSLLYSIFLRK